MDKIWPPFRGTQAADAPDNILLEDPDPADVLETDWKAVRRTETEKKDIEPMTREDLKAFVMGYVDGRIFSLAHIRANDLNSCLPVIFMPLALGALHDVTSESVGMIYEWYGENEAPRSINGYPMFFSCKFMNKDDWERASNAIERESTRRKDIDLDL